MNFLRLANRWDTLKFTNQFSFIWLSNVVKCYWTTVHILRFLVGELLAKLFSAEKRKTRFSKSPLCTLSHCSFVLSIFHDTAPQCYLNVFALFASDSFCISVWTFFDRQQMSPCWFSEAVCDEDFAQGGDRESGRGKNFPFLYLSDHPDQGGAHNGGEESAGEQRAPFHHQFEVSTSLLLHIIIITNSSNWYL